MSKEMRMQKFTTQKNVNGVGKVKGTRYFHLREKMSKEGGNVLPSGNQEWGESQEKTVLMSSRALFLNFLCK